MRNRNQRNKGNRKPQSRGKKEKFIEENVPDDSLNKADAAGLKSSSRSKNDPRWYGANPSLVRDAASFPFSHPVGTRLSFHLDIPTGVTTQSSISRFTSVPGAIIMLYAPVLGGSTDAVSPINVAARALYSYVRHANSGARNYDSPDLMLYVYGMKDVYAYYASMVRLYGMMRLFTFYNRYLPKAIIEEMGWNYTDLASELADFRYYINLYAAKANALGVPANMTAVTRQTWLNQTVFTDSSNAKAQLYLWQQAFYYQYVEAVEGPNYLKAVTGPEIGSEQISTTLATLRAFGDALLEPMLQSEDINIMSGDIIKAYGAENLYTLSPITEDYTTIPTYSAEVLSQIENSFFIPTGKIPDITQAISDDATAPALIQNLDFVPYADAEIPVNGYSSFFLRERIINMHKSDVTPDEMMVATRMMPGITTTLVDSQVHVQVPICGTELPLAMKVVYANYLDASLPNAPMTSKHLGSNILFGDATNDFQHENPLSVSLLSAFDWHPTVYISANYHTDGTETSEELTGVLCDLDNYTLLTNEDLRSMHETALMSEFAAPFTQMF